MRNPIAPRTPPGAFRRPVTASTWQPTNAAPHVVIAPPPAPPEGPRGLSAYLPVCWEILFYVGLVLVALLMRVWELGDRSFHHDESLHAVYSWYIYDGQGYSHNPLMHGPFQFHMNALLFFLLGDTDTIARIGYALFGTVLVAMPWFLRDWLGRTGAMVAAVLIAFSPTILYYSRFARNDIIVAALTLGIIIVIWRYLQQQQPRYLYILAGLLALTFASKETVYILVVSMALFLTFLSLDNIKAVFLGRMRLSQIGPAAALLLLLVTLSLPHAAAGISIFQEPLGIVLSNEDPSAGRIGMPLDAGRYVAVFTVAAALAVSVALGLMWNWRRWLISFGIFSAIWVLLFTNFFTSPFGIVTGTWQGLGYWVAQQDVARGGQPWYYYIVIGWNYEFLPILVGMIGAVWYALRGDLFSKFLMFWIVMNITLFTIASEKMPWLLVHLTLPAILITARALGDLIEYLPWRRVYQSGALMGLPLVPLFLVFGYRLLFFDPIKVEVGAIISLWGLLLLVFGILGLILYLATMAGYREGFAVVGLGFVAALFVLSARVGWIASFRNADTPTEMLVYTQSSPDIARIAGDIARIAESSGQGSALHISVDGDDGYAWPWVWYFRNYDSVGYPSYGGDTQPINSNGGVVLVNANNGEKARQALLDAGFTEIQRFKHRWWFPESYRDISSDDILNGLTDRSTWRTAFDYWLYRDLGTPLGSVDGYLYYSKDLAPFIASDLH
jgi:uncharacterized protein (TIGR03663 family)